MTIKEWKDNGKDYYAGVALYAAQTGHNKNLLTLFTKKKTPSTEAKLRYELSKFESKAPAPTTKTPAKKTITPNVVKQTVIASAAKQPHQPSTNHPTNKDTVYMQDLPKELRPTLERAHGLFKLACRLKIDLNELPAKATRQAFDLQLAIDDAMQENRVCWQLIDFYNDYGYLPPTDNEVFKKMTPDQRVKRQQRKWEAISKAKKRIANYKDQLKEGPGIVERNELTRQLEKTNRLLLKHEQELMELNKCINGNTESPA